MAMQFPHVNFSVSGGEPLTVPWLEDLLDAARNQFGFDTAIITNGLLWSERRAEILSPLLDYAAVSLDGASAETHDFVRGKGTFDRTLSALHLMNQAGIRVVLNVTVMRRNVRDLLENLYPLVASLPFQVDVDLANHVVEGRGTNQPGETLGHRDFQDVLTRIVGDFLDDDWRPLPLSQRVNCGYGSAFSVYANGDVSPCLTPRFIRGNVVETPPRELFQTIFDEADQASVDVMPLCRTCDLRYLCGGKCHLSQLYDGRPPSQNECSSQYRQDYYEGLIERFDVQQQESPSATPVELSVR